MTEHTADLSQLLSKLKRRRISIISISLAIFAIGMATALLWPPTYESSATILIKEQDIPSDLVRTTVTSFASQRIQAISQRIMARPKLLEIIAKYELYQDKMRRLTTEEIIGEMRENIALDMIDAQVVDPRSGRPTTATIAFRLSFAGEHPDQVQQVANELMTLYLKENLRERSEQAQETTEFLNNEGQRLSAKVHTLEEAFINFKKEHGDSLPELTEFNESMLTRADDGLANLTARMSSLEEAKLYIKHKLEQTDPYGADGEDDQFDPATRLRALRTQHMSMVARYSADHPDVQRVEREIRALEIEVGDTDTSAPAERARQLELLQAELAMLRQQYSEDHPDVVNVERQIEVLKATPVKVVANNQTTSGSRLPPTNPEYIDLQTQLAGADVKKAGLLLEKERLEAKQAEYEKRLLKTPQIESQYRALRRDLMNTVERYQEIQGKQSQANIAQSLEEASKGERFEIIEQPVRPTEPISPNRPAIMILSALLALGSGIGFALVVENLNGVVGGSRSLAVALGAAPLASIPYLESDGEASRRKRQLWTRVGAGVGAVILLLSLLHVFWTPLDVLWYKALRKADIVLNT